MTSSREKAEIADRLDLALENGTIPSNCRNWGTSLLSHLRKPLQIGFVGRARSGKSSLISMMLGRRDLTALSGIDIIEINYGSHLRTTFERADGTSDSLDGLMDAGSELQNTVRARLELPDEFLDGCCIVEACLTGSAEHQGNMLRRISRSSAILVYCSEEFSPAEQSLWADVPDEIKDHSFLALTKADRQIMKGHFTQKIAEIAANASDEFLGLHPIATLQAIASRPGKETVKSEHWASSGGKDFHDALKRQIDHGQAEDIDQAEMLLAQFETRPAKAAVSDTPVPEEQGMDAPTAKASTSSVLRHTLDLLEHCSDDLLGSLPAEEYPDPYKTIERCGKAVMDISEFLEDSKCDDPAVADLREDAREGEQMLLLLQLENDEAAATDAVLLLTQLRKEISIRACG